MCHQTVSLVARQLEANGISTVIIGSALDIVEYCGVPRYLFSDFPLGNPCGKPYDKLTQHAILDQALNLLVSAKTARSLEQSPHIWNESSDWKENYMKVDDSNRDKLLAIGASRRRDQALAREKQTT